MHHVGIEKKAKQEKYKKFSKYCQENVDENQIQETKQNKINSLKIYERSKAMTKKKT